MLQHRRRAAAVVGEPGYHALAVAGAGGTWLLDEVVRFQSEVLALRDAQLLSEDCVILPRRATLWCRPLDCAELWRRRNGRLSLAQVLCLCQPVMQCRKLCRWFFLATL